MRRKLMAFAAVLVALFTTTAVAASKVAKAALSIIGAIAIVGSAQAGAEQAAQPENQRVVTLKVSGMQCHLCAGTVERAAKKLTGVVAATADQPKGLPKSPTMQRRHPPRRSRNC